MKRKELIVRELTGESETYKFSSTNTKRVKSSTRFLSSLKSVINCSGP